MAAETSAPLVLVTVPTLAAAGLQALEAAGCKTVFISKGGGVAEMMARLSELPFDAVISRTLPFGAEAIAAAKQLKVISRHGAGYDNVDVAEATRHGIPVLIAPATNGTSVAELAIGLMLASARSITQLDQSIRDDAWDRAGFGLQMAGRTLGLIGLGAIGRTVARAAAGLGMTVIAYDPFATKSVSDEFTLLDVLDDLLARSNVVSLHCPLTDKTRNLIGAREIALMPKRTIVVNTARGGLIDEAALAEALGSGHLHAAGLDTFSAEPLPPSHPFRSMPNVVMTPHMGGSTDAALEATALTAVRHALAILNRTPLDPAVCVNPTILEEASR